MSFRSRLLLGLGAVALVPLAVLALGIRREIGDRLSTQYERRAAALAEVTGRRVEQAGWDVARRLAALRAVMAEDNRLRAAVQGAAAQRPYLLDYAGRALRTAGLAVLRVQDADGRILSSGHFRNEYDRVEPDFPPALANATGSVLMRVRTAEGSLLALVLVDSVLIAAERLWIVGGIRVDHEWLEALAGGSGGAVSVVAGGEVLSSSSELERRLAVLVGGSADRRFGGSWEAELAPALRGQLVRALGIAFLEADAASPEPNRRTAEPPIRPDAAFLITYPLVELHALRASLDRWFLATLGASAGAALLLAVWLSSRLSRPITDLARMTAVLDLDRLDVAFATGRRDEVGALSRVLDALTHRLRAGAARLREAERRATMGEMARQLNHDVKNGLMPIRNVVRHIAQVARDDPGALPRVFAERRETLESSIAYLETLAANYARLSPASQRGPADLNAVVHEVVRTAAGGGTAEVRAEPDGRLPQVAADAVALRRIVENLVTNAVDSLEGRSGTVTVATRRIAGDGGTPAARLIVRDTGRGMTREELDRAFDDFHSTKPGGTGLGLSIVRRLVLDLGGSLKMQSEPGVGTTVEIELPASEPPIRRTADPSRPSFRPTDLPPGGGGEGRSS